MKVNHFSLTPLAWSCQCSLEQTMGGVSLCFLIEAKREPICIRLTHCIFLFFGFSKVSCISQTQRRGTAERKWTFHGCENEINPEAPPIFLAKVSHESWHLNHPASGSCLISLHICNSLLSASLGNYKFKKYKFSYLNSSDHILRFIITPVFSRGEKASGYFKYINIPLMWLLIKL